MKENPFKHPKEMTYSELLLEKEKYHQQYMDLICPPMDAKKSKRAFNVLMESIFKPERHPQLTHHCEVLHELWILDMCNPEFFKERRV